MAVVLNSRFGFCLEFKNFDQQGAAIEVGLREPTSMAASHFRVSHSEHFCQGGHPGLQRLPRTMAGGLLNLAVIEDESSTRFATPTQRMQGESPTGGRAEIGKFFIILWGWASERRHSSSWVATAIRYSAYDHLSQINRLQDLYVCTLRYLVIMLAK